MNALGPFIDEAKFAQQSNEAGILQLAHQFALEPIHRTADSGTT
jgi:hypothetical protein